MKNHMSKEHHHGRETVKVTRGQTIQQDFGKDSSDYTGSKVDERGGGLAGGKSDLSHSISGNKVPRG